MSSVPTEELDHVLISPDEHVIPTPIGPVGKGPMGAHCRSALMLISPDRHVIPIPSDPVGTTLPLDVKSTASIGMFISADEPLVPIPRDLWSAIHAGLGW